MRRGSDRAGGCVAQGRGVAPERVTCFLSSVLRVTALAGAASVLAGCTLPIGAQPRVTERRLRTVTEDVQAAPSRRSVAARFESSDRPDGAIDLRVELAWLESCDITRQVLVERTTILTASEPDTTANALWAGFGGALLAGGVVSFGYFGPTLPSRAEDCDPDHAAECFDPKAAAIGVGITLAVLGAAPLVGGAYGLTRTADESTEVDERVVEARSSEQLCGHPVELHGLRLGVEPHDPRVADSSVDGAGLARFVLPGDLRPSRVVVRHVPEHLEARVQVGEALGWALTDNRPSARRERR